jgi:hypothetical protein
VADASKTAAIASAVIDNQVTATPGVRAPYSQLLLELHVGLMKGHVAPAAAAAGGDINRVSRLE